MDHRQLGEHTLHRYDEELEQIRTKVLRTGGLVEDALDNALQAIRTGDGTRADRVVAGDREINRLELEIDDECIRTLARRSPVAGDLRFIVASIKVVNDLERMGDEAVRIARMAARISRRDDSGQPTPSEIRHLGVDVQRMLHNALDAFARLDVELAASVLKEDIDVDREYDSITRELITFMMQDPRFIPRALDVLFAARALERLGDRACNIAEDVIYLVKGVDVRHAGLADALEQARPTPST